MVRLFAEDPFSSPHKLYIRSGFCSNPATQTGVLEEGTYWSTRSASAEGRAHHLDFSTSYLSPQYTDMNQYGFSFRGTVVPRPLTAFPFVDRVSAEAARRI